MDQLEDKDPFGLSKLDDPEFEARERARLTSSDDGKVPPPEIQQAFVNHVNRYRDMNNLLGDFDIRPDRLFYVWSQKREDGEFYNRCHYKRPTESEFSSNDIQANLDISKDKNGKYFVKIAKYGEGPSFTGTQTERIEVQFSSPHFKSENIDFSQISINAKFNERKLGIYYEKNGDISTFSLDPTNYRNDLYASNAGRQDINIAQLLENGEGAFQSGNNNYRVVYDKEKDVIKLDRSSNGEVKDSVIIPRHLNSLQKFDELVPKPLLDNLDSVEPEEDRTWKDMNLQTFGVTWDMPTANPTS